MNDTCCSSRLSRRTGLLIAALSLVLSILLAEAALWAIDYPPRLTLDGAAVIEHDSLLGWRNRRRVAVRQIGDEFAVWMRFNDRGERGPLRPLEKRPGTTRILVLGDSFVEGYGVEQHERFAELAERELNQQERARPTEVLALGTRGYSTDQQLLWLERNGASYAPDLVVLMFYSNDVWYNDQPRLQGWPKPYFRRGADSLELRNVPVARPAVAGRPASGMIAMKRWLRSRSRTYDLAARAVKSQPLLRDMALRAGVIHTSDRRSSAVGDSVPNEYWVHRLDAPEEVKAAWETTDSLVARMRRHATLIGADFLVFLVPNRELLAPERAADAYALPERLIDHEAVPRGFSRMCTALAVRCLDPRADFLDAADSISRRGRRLYYTLDVHWTPEGHAVAARVLVDAIRQDHLARSP